MCHDKLIMTCIACLYLKALITNKTKLAFKSRLLEKSKLNFNRPHQHKAPPSPGRSCQRFSILIKLPQTEAMD